MKILEHSYITRCLKTGYPYVIKPIEPISASLTVTDDEFAEIVSRRMEEKRRGSESR